MAKSQKTSYNLSLQISPAKINLINLNPEGIHSLSSPVGTKLQSIFDFHLKKHFLNFFFKVKTAPRYFSWFNFAVQFTILCLLGATLCFSTIKTKKFKISTKTYRIQTCCVAFFFHIILLLSLKTLFFFSLLSVTVYTHFLSFLSKHTGIYLDVFPSGPLSLRSLLTT